MIVHFKLGVIKPGNDRTSHRKGNLAMTIQNGFSLALAYLSRYHPSLSLRIEEISVMKDMSRSRNPMASARRIPITRLQVRHEPA